MVFCFYDKLYYCINIYFYKVKEVDYIIVGFGLAGMAFAELRTQAS